jgi:hypothetical protein
MMGGTRSKACNGFFALPLRGFSETAIKLERWLDQWWRTAHC